jgi:hypothetical protein
LPHLTVVSKNVSQRQLRQIVDQIRRRTAAGRVKTHIERAVFHKGKASLGIVKLSGGETQIQQNTIHLPKSQFGGMDCHVGITGLDKNDPVIKFC